MKAFEVHFMTTHSVFYIEAEDEEDAVKIAEQFPAVLVHRATAGDPTHFLTFELDEDE